MEASYCWTSRRSVMAIQRKQQAESTERTLERSVREGDQLKLQSSRLRAHDSSRSMNLRVCAGLPQTRDEPSWGKGEASQSTCLRVVDSGEDPELHETLRVLSTNPLTENA